jgi:signal transduction histidine kinase
MAISLQTRLLLVVGAVALSAVAIVAVGARLGTRVEFDKFQSLERTRDGDRMKTSATSLAAELNHRCCERAVVDAAAAKLAAGEVLMVFDAAGKSIVIAGDGAPVGDVTATFVNDTIAINSREKSQGIAAGMSIMLKGVPHAPITLAGGAPAIVLVFVWPRDEANTPAMEFLGSIDRRLLAVALGVGALALLVTWAVARRIGGPIAELNRATRDLARGDFSQRVASGGADELGDLARSFNHMAAELERQQTLRRNLVHDVAHELRTPLTSLRCRLETVIDGLASDPGPALVHANEEVAHLSQLVADLEELAHAEAGELALSIGDVPLSDVVRSSVRVAGLEHDPRVRFELDERATARGDAMRIRQIVVNLLTNADRHTPADGTITLTVRREAANGDNGAGAVIDVHNSGSALDPDEARRVFDRFYRRDPSRQRATGGSGLGLAIVKHLAEVQDGSACASSDASGVTFSITLPSE